MKAATEKARTAQLRADLSVCVQTACDILDHAQGNAAKLRLTPIEREQIAEAIATLTCLDYQLNKR